MGMRKKSIHDGHRKRLKERFLVYGMDSFADHNVLELVLFFGIPRQDVNPIAHHLINQFGSLAGVLDAPIEELMKIEGISWNVAILLKMIPQLSRRYQISLTGKNCVLDSAQRAGDYLMPWFSSEREEAVYMICLDAKRKVLNCGCLCHGGLNAASVDVRRIVERALRHNASGVILAHNHPSGVALPSYTDIDTTRKIAAALQTVHVDLIDHIVLADDDFVSMAESNAF